MSNPSITADKTPWYQWDTGLTVTVSGGEMDECHFANRKQGTAYVQAVINGVARVPDELLQVAAPVKAYGYVSDGAGGQTYVEQSFEVIARNIPADYTYTKTAQKTIRDAEAARDEAVQAAKDAKASELAADDSAVDASNSAQSAGESASAAATSASNAAKSAGDAAKSASDAKAAASKTVEDASELLKTYTDNAKTSADNAATSASNAADAASAASGSASAAAQSATDANSAKVAAQTAKADAATSASNAATSASNAASSATAAAKSASDAAASVSAINVIAPKTVEVAAYAKESSISVGSGAKSADNCVTVGRRASTEYANNSIAIGQDAVARAGAAVCVGINATANHANSIAIGANSSTSKSSEASFGKPATDSASEFVREITHVSAPTADTSAATKKYTDDNDTKTLSDAKKYTDANTSNALVGTVSGKLLHVEDAWPGKPLGLTIDGAYKQDGTPSPENPVPIVVVENPVLHVIGRNFIDPDKMKLTGTYYANLNGELRIVNGDGRAWSTIHAYGVLPAGKYVIYGDSCEIRKASDDSAIAYTNDGKISFTLQVDTTVKIKIGFGHPDNQYPYVSHCVIAMENSESDTTYAPYVSTSLPITLPAEHPYLAALPDGTHDEIVIDKDGNASLVARVGKTETAATDGVSSTVGTDALSSTGAIEDGATVYYKLATPITYQLGKLDMPALPETISNVWTDAELTTNMSMTYKRDINIAFGNLVQAVVAAAAGE